MLYEKFNSMLDQLKKLKIQVYEEQMEKKEIYVSYLAMQMNPHFYVNSLNEMCIRDSLTGKYFWHPTFSWIR